MGQTYTVKDNVPRAQLVAAIEALNPFYAFGTVLAAANDEGGSAWVTLYDGTDDASEAVSNTIDFEVCIPNAAELVGVNGGWVGAPATYVGPVLQAEDFFKARDAFLACIET